MLATLEIKKSIYESLTNLGLNVFDTLPINTPLPYVQFGNISVNDIANKTVDRQSVLIYLHVWCIDTTSINIHSMTGKVLSLLDVELNLGDSYSHDNTELELLTFMEEDFNNDILNHAVIELKIDVSEN